MNGSLILKADKSKTEYLCLWLRCQRHVIWSVCFCFLPLDTVGIPQVHCAEVSSKNCVCVWPTHAYTHIAWCKVVMHPDRSVTSCLEFCSVDDGYHHCALFFTLQPHRQAWFLTVTLCTENSLFTPANTYHSLIITINGCISGMLWA